MPLKPDFLGREVDLPSCNDFSTLKALLHRSFTKSYLFSYATFLFPPVSEEVLRRWGRGEVTDGVNHFTQVWNYSRPSSEPRQQKCSTTYQMNEQPFLGIALLTLAWGSGLEKVSQTLLALLKTGQQTATGSFYPLLRSKNTSENKDPDFWSMERSYAHGLRQHPWAGGALGSYRERQFLLLLPLWSLLKEQNLRIWNLSGRLQVP